jgi:hypothetical protein
LKISLTPEGALILMLMNSDPSIILGRSRIGLEMNSFMLQPGEDKIIAQRIMTKGNLPYAQK